MGTFYECDECGKRFKPKVQYRHWLACANSFEPETLQRLTRGAKIRFEFSDPPYRFQTEGGGIAKNQETVAEHLDAIRQAGINEFEPARLELIAQTSLFCTNKALIESYLALATKSKASWDLAFYKRPVSIPNYGHHLMTDVDYLFILGAQSPNPGMEREIYSKAFFITEHEELAVAWQKPLELVKKFVKLYSRPGDIVVDRFLGTGTTILACEALGRLGRGVEILPSFVAVALERWSVATGTQPGRLDPIDGKNPMDG